MNGWANYETWNVTLWLGNDESLYIMARAETMRGKSYKDIVRILADEYGNFETPDGVMWADARIDIDAVNAFLRDL